MFFFFKLNILTQFTHFFKHMKLQLSEPLGTSPENSLCSSEKKETKKCLNHYTKYTLFCPTGFRIPDNIFL
jgi:hypothetical protein